MRSLRTLYALLGSLVLIGGILYLERDRPSTDDARHNGLRITPGFDRAKVARLAIERSGSVLRLERRGERWIIGRREAEADESKVESLLGLLELGHVERRLESPDRVVVEKSGVAEPRVRLEAAGVLYCLGQDVPAGHGVYLRRTRESCATPDPILVVEHRLAELLDVPEEDFVSRRLTLEDPVRATKLRLGALEVENRDGVWWITAPSSRRADRDRMQAILRTLGESRAASLLANPVTLGDRKLLLDGRIAATLGGTCPKGGGEQVVRADGVALCFAKESLAPLSIDPATLADSHLVSMPPEEVVSLELRNGERILRVVREEYRWRIVAPGKDQGPAEDEAIMRWLKALGDARTGAPISPIGRQGSLTLRAVDGRREQLSFGIDGQKRVWVEREGESEAFVLSGAQEGLFDPDSRRVRTRQILNFRPRELASLRLARESEIEEVSVSPDGTTSLVEPVGATIDQAKFDELVSLLSDLHVDSYLSQPAKKTRRKIAFSLLGSLDGGAPEKHTLALDSLSDGSCQGELEGERPGPFLLPPSACRVLEQSVIRK